MMEEEEGKKCLLVELIDASAFFEGDLLGEFSVNWFLFFFLRSGGLFCGGGGKLTLNIGILLAFVTVSVRFLMVGIFGGLRIDGWMVDGLRGLKG